MNLRSMLYMIDDNGDRDTEIYLGCPYTDSDKIIMEQRFNQVSACAAMLIHMGYHVSSPITYGHVLDRYISFDDTWERWMAFSRNMQKRSKYMIVMAFDGWRSSRGLMEEIETAEKRNMPYVLASYDEVRKLYLEFLGGKNE